MSDGQGTRSQYQRRIQLAWHAGIAGATFVFTMLIEAGISGVWMSDALPRALRTPRFLTFAAFALGLALLLSIAIGRRFPWLVGPKIENDGTFGPGWTVIPPWRRLDGEGAHPNEPPPGAVEAFGAVCASVDGLVAERAATASKALSLREEVEADIVMEQVGLRDLDADQDEGEFSWSGKTGTLGYICVTAGALLGAALGPVGMLFGGGLGRLLGRIADEASEKAADARAVRVFKDEARQCAQEYREGAVRFEAAVHRQEEVFRSGCGTLIAAAPSEREFPEIERAVQELLQPTMQLAMAIPRNGWGDRIGWWSRRRDPSRLWARREYVRSERERWLDELDRVRGQMAEGRYLDALVLVLTINKALRINGALVKGDWPRLSHDLRKTPFRWEAARATWVIDVRSAKRAFQRTYQARISRLKNDLHELWESLNERKIRAKDALDRKRESRHTS